MLQYKISNVIKGKLTANSASLGPKMLAPSIGYVSMPLTTSLGSFERFKLNNISEFPHYGGLFQMPNIVLGTKDSGKLGKNDDAIVQVKHYGSVVRIMWPKQGTDSFVKGLGDLAKGQMPGKLSNDFEPGEFYNVEKFDHMSLYNYAMVQESGTMDYVAIKIERKPLKNIGATVDQAVEYQSSGSYSIEEVSKDLIRTKQIDYGDISTKEKCWALDVPLVNTKEIRISVKFKNGQTNDVNKSFISYGRFIDSKKET